MKACIGFHKSFSYSSNICCEMDIIKFRDNAMVCGCTTKNTFNLWCDKIKLWN